MSEPRRVPLTGSCHCGHIRYILTLTLPHPHDASVPPPGPRGAQRFYRCNCTVCHKMGHFHVRPSSPAHDFLILSPSTATTSSSPLDELGDYTCYEGNLHFYFCKGCGVRCFIFAGDGEFVTVNLEELGVWKEGGGEKEVKAWRPKLGGGHPEMGHYLSVNGHTIDAGQGFDMRELTEKEMVQYCDCYSPEEDEAPLRYGKPHVHGSY